MVSLVTTDGRSGVVTRAPDLPLRPLALPFVPETSHAWRQQR